ncbi:MAG: SDR family oxidoreductase [Oscillospiraceae bacterium]|nr:SDR family oxidoreductase [Oscillospiraceae bacterium]
MKRVLITGGSRGIGAACVESFSKAGYKVFFTYKNSKEKAEELALRTGAEAICADVSSFEAMKKAALVIGNADIIINNAGISQIKMLQDITEADWDNMFNINIKGMFITVKTFLDNMIHNKWGRIINISSMWGEQGGSCEVHYSASKSAVIGFTKALAKELGPSGITVNCISPGVIDTDMNSHLTEENIDELTAETPVNKIGKAMDIANAALFLASEKSSFITGTVIPVNGGIIM